VKRREFITLLGGAAVAWPLAARAQQAGRMPRIGVLANLAEDDPETRSRKAVFLQELQQLGGADGRNVRIDYRFALGDIARLRFCSASDHAAVGILVHAMQSMAVRGFIAHNRESGAYTLTDSGRATLSAILENAGLK
jgi:hypothetical protein